MTNDAPHSAPTPLSRFLGGWMRHPSPQEPEQVPDDAEATEAAETVEAAEATEAAESAVSPEAASTDGPAVSAEVPGPDAQGEPDATPTAPGDSSTGGETPAGQEVPERAEAPEESGGPADSTNPDDPEGAEETVEEEHVIEVADPRDFADDSGPQYEDEDFDDIVDGEAAPAPGPIGIATPAIAPSSITSASSHSAPSAAEAQAAPAAVAPGDPGLPAPGSAPSAGPAAGSASAPSATSSLSAAGVAGASAADAAASAASADTAQVDPEDLLPPLESFKNRFIDRELTWLDFNERVLEQAEDHTLPLLERAWFLSIFSSNLDEFYMVRVAGLMRRIKAGITPVRASGLDAHQVLAQVTSRTKELTARQAALFQEDIRPALAEHNVKILGWDELNSDQQERLTRYFRHQIYPVLTPLAVDPSHPFPYISGLSLNLAVILRNPRSGKEHFARIKVPDSLPRLIQVPGRELDAADKAAGCAVIPIEIVIGQHLDHLFPGMDILEHHLFRVTRNEDLEVEEDDAENLLKAMEKELERRRFGDCVRLEVEDTISSFTRRYLVRALGLKGDDVFELPAPLDLTCLNQLHDLDIPDLKYPRFVPVTAAGLAAYESSSAPDVFAAMREHDVLLHHPYDSFSTSVQEFVAQAAADPKVLAIKQTLYRTSGDSPIVDALIEAADAGKQVVAIVEIKARFDEEANISWARKLERAGVHVVYGMVGLKTHCKLLLVVRQESDGLRRYCHVGTGNYHPKTARGYEDLGLLTCDRDVAQDLTTLFNQLSGYAPRARFRRLLVAPRGLRDGLVEHIEQEIANRKAGLPAWIRIKVNSIVDETVIDALYRASRAGVPVDIVVRGICGLRAGVEGLSENIRVRSILGRFLEHSRIYAFAGGGQTELFIGSADLMHRNLDRRVEALVRITDPAMVEDLEWLVTHCASDDVASWHLQPDGSWKRRLLDAEGNRLEDIQDSLMARARSRVKGRH
ncbi:RNA degradosome polyphosphate kinase [Actinomyces sp. HMSC08A09]|uniref:RNA degradosome polyphosphate kinase n=1 Tax=Actinomyces sp. HMSC08A09 TaxID=1581133 RepID=UPI0008A4BEE9|nr:RNA degradosome polyphosphate kinase [Actinomyces sp. HMSC08A09]OFT33326.1 RNA degradosome polyphosphate kinase [Actinomyces sp. HMSC08A09]